MLHVKRHWPLNLQQRHLAAAAPSSKGSSNAAEAMARTANSNGGSRDSGIKRAARQPEHPFPRTRQVREPAKKVATNSSVRCPQSAPPGPASEAAGMVDGRYC